MASSGQQSHLLVDVGIDDNVLRAFFAFVSFFCDGCTIDFSPKPFSKKGCNSRNWQTSTTCGDIPPVFIGSVTLCKGALDEVTTVVRRDDMWWTRKPLLENVVNVATDDDDDGSHVRITGMPYFKSISMSANQKTPPSEQRSSSDETQPAAMAVATAIAKPLAWSSESAYLEKMWARRDCRNAASYRGIPECNGCMVSQPKRGRDRTKSDGTTNIWTEGESGIGFVFFPPLAVYFCLSACFSRWCSCQLPD